MIAPGKKLGTSWSAYGAYKKSFEHGTVARQDVEMTLDNGQRAVVTSGVKPGDQVVTGGHSRLTAGSRVSVAGAPAAAAAPTPATATGTAPTTTQAGSPTKPGS